VVDQRLIDGYAEAMLAIAEAEDAVAKVEDELYGFVRAMEADPKLREGLVDEAVPTANRKAVIREVMGDRADPVTVNLLCFAIDAGHARDLPHIVDALAARAASGRAQRLAEVRTAVPLTEEQRTRLTAALEQAMGGPVDLQVVVDPTVVGGMVARVGDEVLDGTVRSRLEEARHRLGS